MNTKPKRVFPGYVSLVVDNGRVPSRSVDEEHASRQTVRDGTARLHSVSETGSRLLPVPVANAAPKADDEVQLPCDV